MSDNNIAIRTEGLTKAYAGIAALDHLDLQIARGKVFGLVGHDGAGKTTTLRILAGLLKPTSGKACICGHDIQADRGAVKSLIGYMPEAFGVYPQTRVWEYLDFFGAAYKIPKKKRRERIDAVLTATGSEGVRDSLVDPLPAGAKQRIGVARAILHDPEVLLLDEPLNGLDARARIEMHALLRGLAKDGKTLLVGSRSLSELSAACDDIGIIDKGLLTAVGSTKEVLAGVRKDRLIELKVLGGLNEAVKVVEQSGHCGSIQRGDAEKDMLRFSFDADDNELGALADKLFRAGVKLVTLRDIPVDLDAGCGCGPAGVCK